MKLLCVEITKATIGEPDRDHDGFCVTVVVGPLVANWMVGLRRAG